MDGTVLSGMRVWLCLTFSVLLVGVVLPGCLGGMEGQTEGGGETHTLRFGDSVLEPVLASFEGPYDRLDTVWDPLPVPHGQDRAVARIDVTEWLPADVPLEVQVLAVDDAGEVLRAVLDLDRSRVYASGADPEDGSWCRMVREEGSQVELIVYPPRSDGPPGSGTYKVDLEVVPQIDVLLPQVPVEVDLGADARLFVKGDRDQVFFMVWGPEDRVVMRESLDLRGAGDEGALVDLTGSPAGRYVVAVRAGVLEVDGVGAEVARALPLVGERGASRSVTEDKTEWAETVDRAPWSVAVDTWFPAGVVSPSWRVDQGGKQVAKSTSSTVFSMSALEPSGPRLGALRPVAEGTFDFTMTRSAGIGEAWATYTYYDRA